MPKHRDFKELSKLMDAPCPDVLLREKHAQNGVNVQKALVKLVPTIIRHWAYKEIDLDGSKHTLACFLVFLHLAGQDGTAG